MSKSASIPSLRVDPELRRAAENVLRPGESLSSFVETSLKSCIQSRQVQEAFLARGLASRQDALASGEYYSAAAVLEDLDQMLAAHDARSRDE